MKQVTSKFTLAITETGTWFTRPERTFTTDSMSCSWKPNLLTIDKLQNTETLTVVCGIQELIISEKDKFRRSHTVIPKTSDIYRLSNLCTLSYLWSIDDARSMETIHNACTVYAFASPIFELFGLKWYLTFYPNGSKIKRKGQANVYLHLASVPSSDYTVWIKQRLTFHHNVEELILRHTHKTDGHGLSHYLPNEELRRLNGLSFYAEITLIDVTKKNKVLTDTFVDAAALSTVEDAGVLGHFEWDIAPIQVLACGAGDKWTSDTFIMYGLTWCLAMDSSGKMYLDLLTKRWKQMDIVSVRCFLTIAELNMRWVLKGIFDRNTLSVNWGEDRISMDEFTNFKLCHMTLDMELIHT